MKTLHTYQSGIVYIKKHIEKELQWILFKYTKYTTPNLLVHMYVPGSSVIKWLLIIIKLACSCVNQHTFLIGRIGFLLYPFVEN